MSDRAASTSPERFAFIDGLRGIAALMVMGGHLFFSSLLLYGSGSGSARPFGIVTMMERVFRFGPAGVQIFFVISGFVIAHSLREPPTFQTFGNFMLRRQVRLDPPYWCAIVIALVLRRIVQSLVRPELNLRFTPRDLLFNLLYVQPFTHTPQVLGVGWTLCVEVQFYLIFAASLTIISRFFQTRFSAIATLAMFVTGLASAWAGQTWAWGWAAGLWFIPAWFFFALGALAYWSWSKRCHYSFFWMLAVVTFTWSLYRNRPNDLIGVIASVLIWGVAMAGGIYRGMSDSISRYFGRISYSLYLLHLDVGVTTLWILDDPLQKHRWNRMEALGTLILAASASILAAHVLNKVVELPSIKWSARLKSKPLASKHACRTPG